MCHWKSRNERTWNNKDEDVNHIMERITITLQDQDWTWANSEAPNQTREHDVVSAKPYLGYLK